MKFVTHEHRFGEHLIKSQFPSAWNDICDVISSVSDDDIIKLHEGNYSKQKSISKALNHLFRNRFVEKNGRRNLTYSLTVLTSGLTATDQMGFGG